MPTLKILITFLMTLLSIEFSYVLYDQFIKKEVYEREYNNSVYWFMIAFILITLLIIYFITKPKKVKDDIVTNPV